MSTETRNAASRLAQEVAGIETEIKNLPPAPQTYAIRSMEPRTVHLLARGDVEQAKEVSLPGTLSCLTGNDAVFSLASKNEGERRKALAKWITSPQNPLTWRSLVNRVWGYHLGRGIVATPNDFGMLGERPTHPELLDWLAGYFLKEGKQSLKKLHRLIVLSATYRQSSATEPTFAKQDSDNRLLWRMNRLRLDAESVRDATLAVSGKLDLTMGGPGFELFAFKDDHSPIYDYAAFDRIDHPKTWRRAVYRFLVRSVPNPFMESLDCADPNINTPVRNTTLTAMQALALLNNPFMTQQAGLFAERLSAKTPDRIAQIEAAFWLTFNRPPTLKERTAFTAYSQKRGLANACRLLLNANEFVFLD